MPLSSARRRWPWLGACCAGLLAALSPSQAWDASLMQAAALRLGPAAVAAVTPLQALLTALRPLDDGERLRQVNQFFNRRIGFRSDLEVWGVEDYWASPLETLAKGEGDCEDYAIAKYASLLAAGMTPSRLRLVYVRARLAGAPAAGQPHMVLAYHASDHGEPLILDNLVAEILPASQRHDLTPVFSFNAEGLWQGVGPASAGDPLARLSRWRNVLSKIREEGFL
ncbi:MAG: transglutaminase-like cysteine peptidase [Rubrivivax sp.]|nr:transglutaminase-like cysteine peptidase [Rubrivivax sp.]